MASVSDIFNFTVFNRKKTVIISSNAILEVVFGDGHPLNLVFDKARPDCTKILNCQIEKKIKAPTFFWTLM